MGSMSGAAMADERRELFLVPFLAIVCVVNVRKRGSCARAKIFFR
jgi:hypothetical protein